MDKAKTPAATTEISTQTSDNPRDGGFVKELTPGTFKGFTPTNGVKMTAEEKTVAKKAAEEAYKKSQLNEKRTGGTIVSATQQAFDSAIQQVCQTRGCEYLLDTTGNPMQSYLYLKNGSARNPEAKDANDAGVWGGPLSHITLVRYEDKLRPVDKDHPKLINLLGDDTGCHLTLRTEKNVLKQTGQKGSATQNEAQKLKYEKIPVTVDEVAQHHLFRGRWNDAEQKEWEEANDVNDPAMKRAQETYKKESSIFWKDLENQYVQKDKGAKKEKGVTQLSPEWKAFVLQLERDIMLMMHCWAEVLRTAGFK